MSLLWIIIVVVLLIAAFSTLPSWHYASNWGYGPAGGIGLVLLIIIVLLALGRI